MSILIIGGGVCGLGTALLLARDGHDVTLLERDPGEVPRSLDEVWQNWTRKGVPQFRQPHNFMPGLRRLLETELPDVWSAFGRAGAGKFDMVHPLPPSFADHSPRPIDDQLWTLTARRPVGEWVFATAAANTPHLTLRRGVQVTGLLTGAAALSNTPHVTGVRTSGGEELRADLVVDAMGRYSRSVDWLAAIGARAPYEEQADSGFAYYTRYFSGTQPARRGPTLAPIGTMSLLTLPGDNGTWSVTIFTSAGDQPLKNLRHEEPWTRTVRACPLHAHWLDGEPTTTVLPMSGIVDRYRRFVVDDAPVVTGFVAVADAWGCTNPSAGRGLTVGFLHGRVLRDVLRAGVDHPARVVREFDRRTEAEIAPWYHSQIATDRARFAEIEALREGRQPPPGDELAADTAALLMTMGADPDLFRAALEYIGTMTPVQEILRRPDVEAKVAAIKAAMGGRPAMQIPGPTRAQLLELMN